MNLSAFAFAFENTCYSCIFNTHTRTWIRFTRAASIQFYLSRFIMAMETQWYSNAFSCFSVCLLFCAFVTLLFPILVGAKTGPKAAKSIQDEEEWEKRKSKEFPLNGKSYDIFPKYKASEKYGGRILDVKEWASEQCTSSIHGGFNTCWWILFSCFSFWCGFLLFSDIIILFCIFVRISFAIGFYLKWSNIPYHTIQPVHSL